MTGYHVWTLIGRLGLYCSRPANPALNEWSNICCCLSALDTENKIRKNVDDFIKD